jgi:hypothetical protein
MFMRLACDNPTIVAEVLTTDGPGYLTDVEGFIYDAVTHALTGETFNHATHHAPLVGDT